MDKVSVIIPAYNSEHIISDCLSSVIRQTYSNIEIIVVDDGSSDRTGDIADEYASTDKRIIVVHRRNGGVSSARNIGLSLATGTWVTFVDSDDYLSPIFIESLQPNEGDDLIVGGYRTVGCHEVRESSYQAITAKSGMEVNILLNSHITDMTFLCPWGKLFRKDIISDNKISFDEKMKIGEDTDFVWRYLTKCNKISLRTGQYYNYYTEPSDFKYAINEDVALFTIEKLFKPLDTLSEKFSWDNTVSKDYIINYYTWLFKLYVKAHYSYRDILAIKKFFYNPTIKDYFSRNKFTSKDKLLVYCILKLRMVELLYIIIKLYY